MLFCAYNNLSNPIMRCYAIQLFIELLRFQKHISYGPTNKIPEFNTRIIRYVYTPNVKNLLLSSLITFRGRLIFPVGHPKQEQPTNTFIKSVNLKLL